MSGPLDAASVRFFKHHGYLVVHRLVPEPQLASYRKQFWDHVGAESSDPGTWPAPPPGGGQLPNIMELRPNLGDLPEIAAVIEQLSGGRFTGGGSMTKAIFPARFPLPIGAERWQRPNGFHIDGYNGQWSSNPEIGATLYLEPVKERGGCFCVKPQQHIPTHQYFVQHPTHIDGSWQLTGAHKERGYRCLYEDTPEPQAPELQFVGDAGSVMFWHGFIPHCASLNAQDRPRLAMIARWSDPAKRGGETIKLARSGDDKIALGWDDVDDAMRRHPRFQLESDMWAHWGPALRECDEALATEVTVSDLGQAKL